jgi:hypothetical protein
MFMYENRVMKAIKIIVKWDEGIRKSNGVYLIKVHYMHVCTYYNEIPLYN